jgi:hypothetical protein
VKVHRFLPKDKMITIMKKLFFLLFSIFLLLSSTSKAQVVFSTQYKYEADVKVFVSNFKYEADLIVFKTDHKYEADKNDGIWFFTEHKYEAKKSVFFTDYKYEADIVVFFTNHKYEAGWQSKQKIHFMF